MPDVEPLLAHFVNELPAQSPEARRTVYDRARSALSNHLHLAAEQGGDEKVVISVKDLEIAIERIEASHAEAAISSAPEEGSATFTGRLDLLPPIDERRRFAFNAAAGGATNLIKVGIQLALLPIMARLLGPEEFGLYALALPTISFFTTLADGGLGASLAREKETSTLVWSTAFWALLSSCTLIALLTIAGSFVLADISHQPRLPGIMMLLSASFPLLALTALPAARLIRRGNLVVHAVADLAATLIGAVVAVSLATFGAGAWALAAQYVIGGIVTCAILNVAAFERPTLEFQYSALRSHAATGGSIMSSRLFELLGRQAENLLFGRLFGSVTLGSYTFANQTSRFLCEMASNPLWGALYAHALRQDAFKVRSLHVALSRLLASTLFPISALVAASAPQLFDVLLGPRWATAAVLLQVMLPFYALYSVAAQCSAIILAMGRSAAFFFIFAGLSAGRVLAVLIGLRAEAVGVAWGIDAVSVVCAAAMFIVVARMTGFSVWQLVHELVNPIGASALGGLVCHALIVLRPESLAWTMISVGAGAFAFVVCMIALQGRRLVADALSIRRIILTRT